MSYLEAGRKQTKAKPDLESTVHYFLSLLLISSGLRTEEINIYVPSQYIFLSFLLYSSSALERFSSGNLIESGCDERDRIVNDLPVRH